MMIVAMAAVLAGCGELLRPEPRSYELPATSPSLSDLDLLVRADERLRALGNLVAVRGSNTFTDAEVNEGIAVIIENESRWLDSGFDERAARRYPVLADYAADIRRLAKQHGRGEPVDDAMVLRLVELRGPLRAAAGLPPLAGP